MARGRIVEVARHQMNMRVRDGVAKYLVVDVARFVNIVDRSSDNTYVCPPGGLFLSRHFGGIGHMPFPKGDDCVTRLRRPAHQVGVRNVSREDSNAKLIFIDAALLTHRTSFT